MIYCNKRKEHIKPEVGQVWSTVDRLIPERVINKYKIVFINKNSIVTEDTRFGSVATHINDKKVINGMFDHMVKESPKSPSSWQPIQGAPKDGSTVLVYHKPLNTVFAGKWCRIGKLWEYDIAEDIIPAGLSHWMPLPAEPKTEDA